jgi:predicted acylesterase/phospholipase RssA
LGDFISARWAFERFPSHCIGENKAFAALRTFVGKPDFGDDHNFFTVRAVDLQTHPSLINDQMLPAPPAFEENVGHLLASAGSLYD